MMEEEVDAMMGAIMSGTIAHMTCIIPVVVIVDVVEVSMSKHILKNIKRRQIVPCDIVKLVF